MALVYYELLQENGDTLLQENGDVILLDSPIILQVVSTQAVTDITSHISTGNGTISDLGGETADKRGVVWDTSTHANPGNVAPAASDYPDKAESTGSFSTGTFTSSVTGLLRNTTYYARAYSHNSAGYIYGDEVNFTTIQFTDPANIYASDDVYATLAATSGVLGVEVSKDAGANWSTPLYVTFGGSDTLETCGDGSTELWGLSFTRADMVDANFRVRLSHGTISQVYKDFGFTTGVDTLTGLEIAVEGNYNSPTLSLDLLEVRIYYGTSVLPAQMGSQAFASDGRKVGEGAGSGTGTLVYYDGNAWRRVGDDTTVVA